MPAFGKKDAQETMLRAIMIHSAAEMYAKEKDLRRVLYEDEMKNIVTRVFGAQKTEPGQNEFSYAMMGAKALIRNRDFISDIVSRWTYGKVSLDNEDVRKSKEIFGSTLKDFAES
jgi:hypothetical protein